jgi:hypothetical protein
LPANNFLREASQQKESEPLRRRLHAARAQIRSRRWQLFSRLLESSLPAAKFLGVSHQELASGGAATAACEESVQVS